MTPFQLLEINIISAQDLARVCRNMHTYAVIWVNPQRKLTTRIDNSAQTNPTWNEKFVFRVDDNFFINETSAVMVEIYTQAWFRDVCVGTVRVLVHNLLPYTSRPPTQSNMRFIALQVRRPSGRPQGILNMGVSLLDSTMRSMPLYSELSASAVGVRDLIDSTKQKQGNNKSNYDSLAQLRRCQSDKTEQSSQVNEKSIPTFNGNSVINMKATGSSMVNGSMLNGSEVGGPPQKAGGGASMVSDVGPSASIVAAAIAKGIYPLSVNRKPAQKTQDDGGSCILNDWTEKDTVEGLRTKIERWRTELPPVYDNTRYQRMTPGNHRHRYRRRRKDGGGLLSCFGNACGCEFSVTCGGATAKKKFGGSKVSDAESQSYL